MATQAQAAVQDLPPEQTTKKSRKKLWFVLSLLLLIASMGGAGLMLMFQPGAQTEEEALVAEQEARAARPPVFLALEPFVVNLRTDEGDNYLRLGVVLEGSNQDALDAAKQQLPRIRNAILLLLSVKSPEELSTMEGKERLMEEIIAAARGPMPLPAPAKGIESVYFSDFVIQ